MNPEIKPRADSTLKTLPEDRQSELADFAARNTLQDTVTWLRQAGIQTSAAAVSRFLSWHHLHQQLARNESAVLTLTAELEKQNPSITPDRLHELGQLFFATTALEKQDGRAWYLIQQITLLKAQHQFELTKYQDTLQARKEAIQHQLESAKATGGISPETFQKIERELNLC